MNAVRFIAEYEDGSKEPFDIPRADLRSGDHVAKIIAGERQHPERWAFILEKSFLEGGLIYRLKPGKILRVYRNPSISYFPIKGLT